MPMGSTRANTRMPRMAAFMVFLVVATLLGPSFPAAGFHEPSSGEVVEPSLHTPVPMPGTVVPVGATEVGAWLDDAEPASWTLAVDGIPVVQTRTEQDAGRGIALLGTVDLREGDHQIVLEVRTEDGADLRRAWTVTATARTISRIAGEDRYDTAVAVSRATYPAPQSVEAAVLARGDDFADALAGAPLAVAVDGPLLLTGSTVLPASVATELERVLTDGGTVHLLGGTAAISAAVADELRARGHAVERHAGPDRYATAAAIARRLPPNSGAIVVAGASFADALAASVPAARDGLPILLTRRDALPEPTLQVLSDRGVRDTVVVGGTAVVADDVVGELEGRGRVTRVAGEDRYATAAAVLATFYDQPAEVALASGTRFPDALSGTRHAAATGRPLLLSSDVRLPGPTGEVLARIRPESVQIYGGEAALHSDVATAALHAIVDGPEAPRPVTIEPGPEPSITYLDDVQITFDRPVDPQRSTVHVVLGDREVTGTIREDGPSPTLTFSVSEADARRTLDVAHDGTISVHAHTDGGAGRASASFTLLQPDPMYATIGPLRLHVPSRNVELIGYHQSSHDGAQQHEPRETATGTIVLPSRGRGTGRLTAADIVADPAEPLVAPVTGRVVRAGTYRLYCDYPDHYLVIEPDARPGWEVKLLHFHGLQVSAGDRVVAGETLIGTGPRQLPFESQVDRFSQPRNWPHVHLEVVDPSIPDRPGKGC